MLYITTRSDHDAFTAHRALHESFAGDAGQYLPFRLPAFEAEQITALASQPFGQTVADIMNVFFSAHISGWDVDFCIGRTALRTVSLNHRISVAELWHNPTSDFAYLKQELFKRICGNDTDTMPSLWFDIAVRIAVLFGIYGQLYRDNVITAGESVDVSVPVAGLTAASAALYAKEMGLPISTVICACEEDSAAWDLIHKGEVSASAIDESLHAGLERIIHIKLGYQYVEQLLDALKNKKMFFIDEESRPLLSDGLFCVVSGRSRAEQTINSIFRSCNYIADPVCAVCVGSLQDYRAKTGHSRQTIVISEKTPVANLEQIYKATGLTEQSLIQRIHNT